MSHQQPGPYGPPPQQPQQPPAYGPPQGTPYGPPQGAPQGAPQQYPTPGYGAPHYPSPYPPVPPQGGGKGKRTGLVVGAVVVAAALVAGGLFLLKDGKSDGGAKAGKAGAGSSPGASGSPSPSASPAAKRYKLITPDTVGEYKKDPTQSSGESTSQDDVQALTAFGLTNPKSVDAVYTAGAGAGGRPQRLMTFTGGWGDELKHPEAAVDLMFMSIKVGTGKNGGSDVRTDPQGQPQKVTPAGLEPGAVMKCQLTKMSSREKGGTASGPDNMTMPVCVWADTSTLGMVFVADIALIERGKALSLDEAASRTVTLRQGLRVENH
ncbi:hypothetical protein BLA24_20825 [Streptomyces cinnamoneus]|uniref:Uncharacterized protein n=1 Tax=Streptomyces cinnamoneus TaxID=53446 RepID=A0A2G1XFP1_STRCJ|nr:hypothetical protein [Streptomyces cinnamoneus]PHQ50052.1 hypothetical protein BLA24_20825 [Streptomyces cinnamoneus]PPT13169.1 hypothetical protein CYQ11_09955 [Streptomyces cinnamoneus]